MSETSTCNSGLIIEGSHGTKYTLSTNTVATPPQFQITQYCPHCNLTFGSILEYEHHNVELHGRKRNLTCDTCAATFKRQDHLKRHVLSLHSNHRNCICPVCGEDLRRQDALLRHIKGSHCSGNEIFHCRGCNYECSTHVDLEKHELTHNMERHVCPHCSTTFKRRDHMLRHVKSQHLNECVVCPVCNVTYKRKDHLVRHVREKHRMGLLDGKLVKSYDLL